MGLDLQNLRAILAAKASGVDFSAAATLGRQTLMISEAEAATGFSEFGQIVPETGGGLAPLLQTEFADALFQWIGGHRMESIDTSDYEQADYLQDLNQPLKPELRERFSLLIDGGSLEHVYHFPQALTNCAQMVRPGGHLLICNIANNFCGHGFYQFSPELFYRVLSPENGFRIEWLVFAEYGGSGGWIRVPDPAKVGQRLDFTNCVPTYIFVLAKKLRSLDGPLQPAQQSDYVAKWQQEEAAPAAAGNSLLAALPLALKMKLRSVLAPYRRPHLTKVSAHQLRSSDVVDR